MAIKLHISKLEDVPEALRSEYKADPGGGFVIDWEGASGYSVDKVAALKQSLSQEREQRKAAEAALKPFRVSEDSEDLIDPAAARAAMAKIEDLGDDGDVQKKVDAAVQAKLAQVEKKHQSEVTKRDERNKALSAKLQQVMIDDLILRELMDTTEGRTAAIDPKPLVPYYRQFIRLEEVEKDGRTEFVHKVVDETGTPLITAKSGSNDAMTPREFFTERRKSEKHLFKAPERKGAGSGGDGDPGRTTVASPSERRYASGGGSEQAMSARQRLNAAYTAKDDGGE